MGPLIVLDLSKHCLTNKHFNIESNSKLFGMLKYEKCRKPLAWQLSPIYA